MATSGTWLVIEPRNGQVVGNVHLKDTTYFAHIIRDLNDSGLLPEPLPRRVMVEEGMSECIMFLRMPGERDPILQLIEQSEACRVGNRFQRARKGRTAYSRRRR